jgi:hypothetical protein
VDQLRAREVGMDQLGLGEVVAGPRELIHIV